MKSIALITAILLSAAHLVRAEGHHSVESPPVFFSEQAKGFLKLAFSNFIHAEPSNTTNSIMRSDTLLWVDAGEDATLCISQDYFSVNGAAGYYQYLLWTSSGKGFFDNANQASTVYYPSEEDIESGWVRLYLTGWSYDQTIELTDSVDFFFSVAPICYAGSDSLICECAPMFLSGTAENYSSVLWLTSGDGDFENPGQINTVYYPGGQDIEEGNVILCLQANPVSPCTQPSINCLELEITRQAFLDAGSDTTLCEGEQLELQIQAENYQTILWSTSGDGSFTQINIKNPVYIPGEQDIETGSVELHVMLVPNTPCAPVLTDNLVLNVQKNPFISHDPYLALCANNNMQLQAEASHYDYLQWTSYGDGTFSDISITDPVYFPGEADVQNGNVFLEATTFPVSPCVYSASAYMVIFIMPTPEACAGNDTILCAGQALNLAPTVSNYSSLEWQTSGDGIFDNPGQPSTVYYPGQEDMASGEAILTLQLNPDSPCIASVSDELILTLAPQPTVFAGNDTWSCSQIDLEGTANMYNQLYWTTNGDGTFSNPGIADPVYYAGDQDQLNLSVDLFLFAEPLLPCTVQQSDTMVYHIDYPEIVFQDMEEKVLFEGDLLIFTFEASSYLDGNYQWFCNGVPVSLGNGSQVSINGVEPQHAGYYHCLYSNECFQISSDTALVVVYESKVQILQLDGGWSGISSFVDPENPDMSFMFQPVLDDFIMLSNFNGLYWPRENINTFNTWECEAGYMLKMSDSASLTMIGYLRHPPAPISIPPGWSLIPVGTDQPVEVVTIFGNYPQVSMIKEVAGTSVYWPANGINSLEYLEPGNAYLIYNSSPQEMLISYPLSEE